jgi:internalin A
MRRPRLVHSLLLLAICPAFGVAGADAAEGRAASAVEALGGTVGRDRRKDDRPVVSVSLMGTAATDDDLKRLTPLLSPLGRLTGLSLSFTKVGDDGAKAVTRLNRLTGLGLAGTRVTDAGLRSVAKLDRLEALDLNLTGVTDAGLKELAPLRRLETLELAGTGVTDAGLLHLTRLGSLTELNLRQTRVTDAGVEALRRVLPKCQVLR